MDVLWMVNIVCQSVLQATSLHLLSCFALVSGLCQKESLVYQAHRAQGIVDLVCLMAFQFQSACKKCLSAAARPVSCEGGNEPTQKLTASSSFAQFLATLVMSLASDS